MLSVENIKARELRLTASRVGVLMSGDPEKVMALWEEMLGVREPDDLSDVWAVQLGIATEALNLDWYERRTGRALTRKQEFVISPEAKWAACTLDGFDAALGGPVEAKCVGGFEPRATVIARYMPQAHWQMRCTGTTKFAFSIIEGGREPAINYADYDEAYGAELWARGVAFMQCLKDLTPPMQFTPVAAPVPQDQWRECDMTGNNAWSSFAADWLAHKNAAKKYETANKELKALVDPDVGLAFGHAVKVKRSKTGSLTVSAMKG